MNDKVLTIVSPAPSLLREEAKGSLRHAPLEIEAKFTVPDPVVCWSLQTTDHLAGFSQSTTWA